MKVSLPDTLQLCVGSGCLGACQWHRVASCSPRVGVPGYRGSVRGAAGL